MVLDMGDDFSEFLSVLRPQIHKPVGSGGVLDVPHVDSEVIRTHKVLGIGAHCQTVDAERVAILILFHYFTFTQNVGELLLRDHKPVVHNLRWSVLPLCVLLDLEQLDLTLIG